MYKVESFFAKLFRRCLGDSENDSIGPRVLHDSCVGPSTGVDIVFVHGLRGSPVKTWSTGEYFWPKDFLSVDLKNARIITWGYDANVANVFSSASNESIPGHAGSLLDDLDTERSGITRPIIFVCHSLGGLVVKEALIMAAEHMGPNPGAAAIYTKTIGVLFFGTPHRGSGKTYIAKLFAKGFFLHRPNKQLLWSLAKDSHFLERQRRQFVNISKNLSIVCVREEVATHVGIISIGMIVPEASASYDGVNVRTGAIHADHINMVKFKSRADVGYRRVLGWITWVRNSGLA